MNNQLVEMQKELQIAKQESEILHLKFELQKAQAQKASRLDDSLFAPALYQHYQNVAVTLSKSSVVPNAYRGKPEDIFVAMAMGYQLGFPVEQSLQDIAVINGRPCLWGDGLLSLALNHPDCHSIIEEPIMKNGAVWGYMCTVTRTGHEPHQQQFTMADAERAKLIGKQGPWTQYPARMLQMRARSFAIRDKFADALRGLRIAEVEQDHDDPIEGDFIRQDGITQTQKLNTVLQIRKSYVQKSNAENQDPIIEIAAEDSGTGTAENAKPSTVVPPRDETLRVHNTGRDDVPASDEQLEEIQMLMQEKGFDDERLEKALAYFKIEKLEHLSDAKARVFLLQLGKA